MGDEKKWLVTYTKHVKQKRKVYQDGILQLFHSNKVMLYDECEQLLDTKFLTKDEAVKSGESLAFASFLVDVGDPINNCNSNSNPNIKSEYESKSHEKTKTPQRENLRNSFTNRKPQTAGRKASLISLSPSQRIIRDFKKNEGLKYGAHHSPTSPATSSIKEWEALYTTQITQKAKKYHDGFIRMIICGSQGRQVILYDSSKSQIDKRFLKKDEVISSGESLTFDAHLVDIGDPIGTNEDDADMNIQGRNNNPTEKSLAGRQWKKLVIAQPQDNACSSKCVNSSVESFGFDRIKQKTQLASHTTLRDANQILSILRKPITRDAISNVGGDPMEQCVSRSSEPVQLDDDSQPGQAFDSSNQVDKCQVITGVEEHTDEKAANEGHFRLHPEGSDLPSKATHADSTASTAHANCSSNNVERSLSTQGVEILNSTASESPRKSQPIVGSSVHHEESVVLQTSKGFVDSSSSVNSKTTTHHQEHSTKLPQTNPESKERKCSSLDMSRPLPRSKWSGALGGLKTAKYGKNEKSNVTSDFPSFDLGIS